MGDRTGIEYLRDRNGVPGATWNPTTGCSQVSAGCENCWARGVAETRLKIPWTPTCRPERLAIPLRWRRPRNVAVSFMGDMFHPEIDGRFVAAVYGVMAAAPRHTFVVCTKRPERAREVFEWLVSEETASECRGPRIRVPEYRARHRCAREWAKRGGDVASPWVTAEGLIHTEARPGPGIWPLPNVVFLFSAEDQATFDDRVDDALAVPAAVHGVSLEPLLGPIDLRLEDHPGLRWVIVGCESGPRRRCMDPTWAWRIMRQCSRAGVPFFFKQAEHDGRVEKLPPLDGLPWTQRPEVML